MCHLSLKFRSFNTILVLCYKFSALKLFSARFDMQPLEIYVPAISNVFLSSPAGI